ncbi:metalloregulator ArsR/SmtB family transcription factor [Paenibacillus oenotherae]|uniref:Metalloregulator ArsR/SmtB family transcription factor n=1 Tax=Paenibacillus oenotherae TaxID=1435645 RepID=A0ABS7DBS8_9BACL|nr:metalloregulator ArsR/SmtB family transcription factor [Paenibacillus oenotherae]MBW7477193.1 metalloregulator ArsR/SmtB family transcription factor [Paenibacillus oenotherae]
METPDTSQLEIRVHEQLRSCSPIFLALADPVRQDIIMMLTKHEKLNVAQIVERSPMSRSAISHHLKILRQANLISSNKVATEIFYSLEIESAVSQLKDFIGTTEQIIELKTPDEAE